MSSRSRFKPVESDSRGATSVLVLVSFTSSHIFVPYNETRRKSRLMKLECKNPSHCHHLALPFRSSINNISLNFLIIVVVFHYLFTLPPSDAYMFVELSTIAVFTESQSDISQLFLNIAF